MGVLHFLNVGQGDCSIIQHLSGRITVIDVCKARSPLPPTDTLASVFGRSLTPARPTLLGALALAHQPQVPTNPFSSARSGATLLGGGTPFAGAGLASLAQAMPSAEAPAVENPIRYMRDRGMDDVFRFILSHPDMDHMDGIKDLFEEFRPANFWDTANTCSKTFTVLSPYREEDWQFYKGLRDGTRESEARRLVLYSGARGQFFNRGPNQSGDHDGLYILAPTPDLVAEANRTGDFNDASYVILYKSAAGRILFCGDAHDKTWEHVIANHRADVREVELMIAPHHGRDSGRNRAFLDEVRPKLTLLGTAPSQHLAYDAWRNRHLEYITCNQARTVVVDTNGQNMQVYVAKEAYARRKHPGTTYSHEFRAWHIGDIA